MSRRGRLADGKVSRRTAGTVTRIWSLLALLLHLGTEVAQPAAARVATVTATLDAIPRPLRGVGRTGCRRLTRASRSWT
jgi:hypothetical protein